MKAAPPAEAASPSAPAPSNPQPSQPPPAKPPANESGPMIPGDPGTAVKVYKRGQDAARKLEEQSQKTADQADDADAGE